MKNLVYLYCLVPFFVFAQVGINTTTPVETLHVEGTLCVSNTSTKTPDKISGTDPNGVFTDVVVGENLQLSGNVLNANGPKFYFIADKSIPGSTPGAKYNNLDLDLLGVNSDKTLFRLIDRTANYMITGIAGGTNGRHIVLYNVSFNNLSFPNQSANSLPPNRIITLGSGIVTTVSQGTAELVYDGTAQRWILISFRE